jgi:hypothetical protein
MVIFLSLWTPLVTLLPVLLCSETMAMADIVWGMILLIPALIVMTGIIMIIGSVFEPSYPQQGNY